MTETKTGDSGQRTANPPLPPSTKTMSRVRPNFLTENVVDSTIPWESDKVTEEKHEGTPEDPGLSAHLPPPPTTSQLVNPQAVTGFSLQFTAQGLTPAAPAPAHHHHQPVHHHHHHRHPATSPVSCHVPPPVCCPVVPPAQVIYQDVCSAGSGLLHHYIDDVVTADGRLLSRTEWEAEINNCGGSL